jgi:hypothetical protein
MNRASMNRSRSASQRSQFLIGTVTVSPTAAASSPIVPPSAAAGSAVPASYEAGRLIGLLEG